VRRATHDTEAGRRYLELQGKGKQTGRPTDELIQLYALEGFLDRLARSAYADLFVLKGGVLLAALDARRPTRDIDLAGLAIENSAAYVLGLVREIAAMEWGSRHDRRDAVARNNSPARRHQCGRPHLA